MRVEIDSADSLPEIPGLTQRRRSSVLDEASEVAGPVETIDFNMMSRRTSLVPQPSEVEAPIPTADQQRSTLDQQPTSDQQRSTSDGRESTRPKSHPRRGAKRR